MTESHGRLKNRQSKQALHCATRSKTPSGFEGLFEEMAAETLHKIVARKIADDLKISDNGLSLNNQGMIKPFKGVKVMASIKETMEVIDELKSLLSAYKSSMADGKINVFDFKFFVDPLVKLKTALQGLKEVSAELKDLDSGEAQELMSAVVELVQAAVEASEKL